MPRIFLFIFSVFLFGYSSLTFSQTQLYSDDFEAGFGSWTNVTSGDNKNWTRDSGGTPSSSTGPATGSGSSYYLYLETSYGEANAYGDSAILLGPPISSGSGIQLNFDYHMYGATIGTLYVDVLENGIWTSVWSIAGQQHSSNTAAYMRADIDLSAYSVSQIRLRAVAVGDYRGDMAIDNVEIWSAPSGPAAPAFSSNPLTKEQAIQDQTYSSSIATDASDANGDALTFTKLSGPTWLNLSSDGIISGTPGEDDIGSNEFVIQVSDGALSSSATLIIEVLDNSTPILLYTFFFFSFSFSSFLFL